MKKVLYYHLYLSDDYGTWTSMFLEQMKQIEDSGLLKELKTIKVIAITQNDSRIRVLSSLCTTQFDSTQAPEIELMLVKNPYANDQEMLDNIESDATVTENFTYRQIYEACKNEDFQVCYIHSKGITAADNFLKGRVIDAQRFKNYYYWRQFLSWGVIKNWKKCITALETGFDVAGVNFFAKPAPHFSGNFWWANSSYIRTLPDPATKDWWHELQNNSNDAWLKTTTDRFRDEQWLCSNKDVKVYKVIDIDQEDNPASKFLPQSHYEEIIT
jgi:hypothetical protein